MLALRSLLYNFALYLSTIVQMVFWTPFYFLSPRKASWYIPKFWARSCLWLMKVICGSRPDIRGMENLPSGPFILAPKHQSFWDVLAFFPYLEDPLFILKRELRWIPFFGLYIIKQRLIPVDRGKKGKALRDAIALTRIEMADNRQLIIYPEGTRRPPGAEPAYKWGIAEIYSELGLPVVPVAHQAGLFWPRRKFLRHPGTIHGRFLPPIPPGLSKEAFMARLVAETEAACDAILVETADGPNPPPLPEIAARRLAELRAAKAS